MISSNRQTDYERAIQLLKPFTIKNTSKANFQFFFTFIMLWSSIYSSYYFLGNYNLVLLITIPTTVVFLCRSYVILHDCGHNSFSNNKTWENSVGTILGFGIMISFSMWRYIHNSHHNHVGNLDKREWNPEVWTMTIEEYKASSLFKRLIYRFMRSRFTRFFIVPTINFGLIFRFLHPKFSRQVNLIVLIHDIIYVALIWFLLSYMSIITLVIVFFLPLALFYNIAAFSLYTQHQFEETYWEKDENWNYFDASFSGSNCVTAPRWFRWMTGNALYHNIHHLCSNIPSYKLDKAQKELGTLLNYKLIPISEGWNMLGKKLWDEENKKLVGFSSLRNK